MNAIPKISIIVRSHNDVLFIARTLSGLLKQTVQDFELISCDDRSTDGTDTFITAYPGATSIPPDANRYVPGKVLNRAIQQCRGEIVVFNNADAVILAPDWLERLIAPFSDPEVAATFANQKPRPDAWRVVKKDNERAFGDGTISASWSGFFSLASSAARRELLLEHPFNESLQYSEDVEWASRIRTLGRRIVYVPEAQVEHSHNYPPRALWKRFFNEGKADAVIFGKQPSFPVFVRQFLAETIRDYLYVGIRGWLNNLFFAPFYRFIQKFAYYRGLQAARREKKS